VPTVAEVLSPLAHVLFRFGGDRVSVSELLGFVTGAWCVWLTVRARILNFPVGIANDAFFLVLFLEARLYADSALQVVYIALGAAGWWQWARGDGSGSPRPIGRASLADWCLLLAAVAVATTGLTLLLRATSDAAPFWDALTTALSLGAQWLLNFRKIDNWFLWAAADLIYVPFYAAQRLDLTAIVYAAFLGMCVAGYLSWARSPQAAGAPAALAESRLAE
jgi:nicotinamide mononucleotide transporter